MAKSVTRSQPVDSVIEDKTEGKKAIEQIATYSCFKLAKHRQGGNAEYCDTHGPQAPVMDYNGLSYKY